MTSSMNKRIERIYVASSWRNDRYRKVLDQVRAASPGVYVYDFQFEGAAFDWKDIDPDWDSKKDIKLNSRTITSLLQHPLAIEAFKHDFNALLSSDLVILVNPCGKSAHIEAGVAFGSGIPVWILQDESARPELTYKIAHYQTDNLEDMCVQLTHEIMRQDSCIEQLVVPPVYGWNNTRHGNPKPI